MASVPNMRLTPAATPGDTHATPETDKGDLFARLMALTPLAANGASAEISGDTKAGDGVCPAETDEESDSQADEPTDLALPVLPADFIPLLAAQAAAPVVANAAPPAVKAAQTSGAKPTTNPAGSTPIQVPTLDVDAPTPTIQPDALTTSTDLSAATATTLPLTAIVTGMVKPKAGAEATSQPKAELPDIAKESFEPAKPGKPIVLNIPAVAIDHRTTSAPNARVATTPAVDPRPAAQAHGQSDRADTAPPPVQVALPTAPAADASQLFTSASSTPDLATQAPGEAARPADTANSAVERHLNLVRDSEWLDQLARDIVRTGNADTPMRFKLHPQTLGHLKVELSQGDQGTSVRFTTETEAARNILTDAQPRLAAEARAQGLRIAETNVDLAGSGQDTAGDSRRQEGARTATPLRTAGSGADQVEKPSLPARGTDRFA